MIRFITNFSTWMKAQFQGTPFGDVYPAKALPTPSHLDGRTAALRLLARYLSELTFYRTGAMVSEATATADRVYGSPIAFQIPLDNIHTEHPDGERELSLPTIAITPGNAEYGTIGLVTWVCPETKDVYGKGSIVAWMSDYVENLSLEITAQSKAERRAILVGLEQALMPTEQMSALRFKMGEYYGQLCAFTIGSRSIDDTEAGQGRRKARVEVELNYTVCTLVNYVTLQPFILSETSDDSTFVVETEVVQG